MYWATWLQFTNVYPRYFGLHVRRPGPLGSCSLVCTRRVLCCVCGVPGHLAPVHRCIPSACCVAFAASLSTWLLFTGVLAWCAVLRVRGVAAGRALDHPNDRCFVAARRWVPSWRAHLHPDGGCYVAGRGQVCCRARTRPSGRRLVACLSCPGRSCGPIGRVLVRLPIPVAVPLLFWTPSGCLCPWCVCVCFVFLLRCLAFVLPLFPALAVMGLCALWLLPPALSYFLFLLRPLSLRFSVVFGLG